MFRARVYIHTFIFWDRRACRGAFRPDGITSAERQHSHPPGLPKLHFLVLTFYLIFSTSLRRSVLFWNQVGTFHPQLVSQGEGGRVVWGANQNGEPRRVCEGVRSCYWCGRGEGPLLPRVRRLEFAGAVFTELPNELRQRLESLIWTQTAARRHVSEL